MAGEPVVVVCTTRSDSFAGVQRLFRPQGLAARTAGGREELVELLCESSVQLALLDLGDPELDVDGVLDVLAGGGTSRFLPVLLLGSGERAEHARERLASQVAVRTLELEAVRDPLASGENAALSRAALRRHARVPLRVRVQLDDEGTTSAAQSHDLSEEGIGVIASRRVGVGRVLSIEFALPGEPGRIQLAARVRRAVALSGGGWFLGLWFPQVTADVRARLRAFVQRETGQTSSDGPPP